MKSKVHEDSSVMPSIQTVGESGALAALFAASGTGLALFNSDGSLLDCNQQWCDHFGLGQEELRLQPLVSLLIDAQQFSFREDSPLFCKDGVECCFRTPAGSSWGNFKAIKPEGAAKAVYLLRLDNMDAIKNREAQLIQAERGIQIIANRIPAMISYVDTQLRYLFVNEQYERVYRKSRDEILGLEIRELLSPVTWRVSEPFLHKALAGETVSYETDIINAAGDVINGLVRIMPDKASDGAIRGLFVHVTDVSALKTVELELKAANNALMLSENNFRAMMEDSPAAIFVLSNQGVIQYSNQRTEQMFGLDTEAVLGQSIFEWIPDLANEPAWLAQIGDIESESIAGNSARVAHALNLSVSSPGTEKPVVDVELSLTQFNRSDVILATVRNISSFRAAFESTEQIAAIVEASGDAVIRVDITGKILYWSRGAERLYGYTEEEMLGDFLTVINPSADSHFRKNVLDLLQRKETWVMPSATRIHKDGSIVDVSISLFPILDKKGKVIGGASVHRDIRDLKRLEEQLRHSQRLETAGLLAGGVAHDFNNILTVIQGYCSMLLENLGIDAQVLHQVKAIDAAAQRASTLTRQLLAFSQKQRTETRVLNPGILLEELAPILQRALGEDIMLESVFDTRWSIKDDPANFEQVILNLAVNARHAMPLGGRLSVEAHDVHLHSDEIAISAKWQSSYIPKPIPSGDYVCISIRDTGMGISQTVLDRIFEPFFTTKKRGEGTGLGLSVVYGVVNQNGGGLCVCSTQGAGTEFSVYLPRSVEEDVQAGNIPLVKPEKGKGNILLVEDDPDVLRLAQAILESAGYKVFPQAQVSLALKTEYPPIDLVLSDVVMPDMNGPEFIKQWLQKYPNTPYLFMSGYADEAVLSFSVRENLILKPFKPSHLLEKIGIAISPE